MKNVKTQRLFVSILVFVTVTMSFLCSCAEVSDNAQQVVLAPKEENTRKEIRIATWYEDSYITNFKAYLAE